MKRYIVVDYYAVKELISLRELQSSDFEESMLMINFLKNGESFECNNAVYGFECESGRFLVTKKFDEKRILIFDLNGFSALSRASNEIVTIFQKTFRLAMRLWENFSFSPCEKPITGTNYIALFPFPFATGTSYKVILDKSPDSKRQEKRDCNNFMVFFDGINFDSSKVSPSMSVLRQADDDIRSEKNKWNLFIENKKISDVVCRSNFVQVEETNFSGESISPYIGMEAWKKKLTSKQKSFVFSNRLGPDILKGAAGTGKTLCLVLRCINNLSESLNSGRSIKAIFFTHSYATKKTIESLFISNGGSAFLNSDSNQKIIITTLQEWCLDYLDQRISDTEYLDKDALESKNTQLLYINEVLEEFFVKDFSSSKNFISDNLLNFFEKNDLWTLSLYFQNEIANYIKGRAREDFDSYRRLDRSFNSIPLVDKEDFDTVFFIYMQYQQKLLALNVFDSDDIAISALQETLTPIWRRRRVRDGYDVLYVDETHLFNLNELSLFHNLLKAECTNIVYTIDKSQAAVDSLVSSQDVGILLGDKGVSQEEHKLGTVFRCSDDIINLASCVLASGATFFSQMENPLLGSTAGFTDQEEKLCKQPYLIKANGFDDLIVKALNEVDSLSRKMHISKSEILIIPCDDFTQEKLKTFCLENKLSLEVIESRGDNGVAKKAVMSGSYLSGTMDFIGGLEFPCVVILGIDKDKFPKEGGFSGEASHFLRYAAFNNLYVAITRAKYVVVFVSDKTKGLSLTISAAVDQKLIVLKDSE